LKLLRMCLNWKVLLGLGISGVAIWAIAPNMVLAALPLLLFAACPLSMVVMMWTMRHAMQGRQGSPTPTQMKQPMGAPLIGEGQTAQQKN